MYKAIILDFGGVVFKNKPKDQWIGPHENLTIDSEKWNLAGVGQYDEQQLFKEIAHNHQTSPEIIKQWLFSRREPNQELLNFISSLDMKKAILNNGLKTLFREFLEKYPEVEKQFDVLINSAEEDVRKPDPKIYHITTERLNVKPEECIFVDDDQGNIDGAEKLGMHGIFFQDTQSLSAFFKAQQ